MSAARGVGGGAQGSLLCTPESSLPTQAGAGPKEGGTVLPLLVVGSGSQGAGAGTGGGVKPAGPSSCLGLVVPSSKPCSTSWGLGSRAGSAQVWWWGHWPSAVLRAWFALNVCSKTILAVAAVCPYLLLPGFGTHWHDGARWGSKGEKCSPKLVLFWAERLGRAPSYPS